jgi:hypothetical protein
MDNVVSQNTMLILNGLLAGLYGVTFLFGLFRVIVAHLRSRKFLLIFFTLVTIIAGI